MIIKLQATRQVLVGSSDWLQRRRYLIGAMALLLALLVVGCSSGADSATSTPEPTVAAEEHEDDHMHEDEDDEHASDEHMEGMHGVPEEAAAVPNPVEGSEESIADGQALYTTNCAVCHGDTGKGDGPSAAGLDPKPANLHEDHVQDLSDGALFHIITHGVAETAMPPWEDVLSEDERWNVINFLRTFHEE